MRFCLLLLLALFFDSLQGSSLPKVRKTRALNTTLQTKFNGSYESRNPCTNAEIERSTYEGSQEFHHHSNRGTWADFTHSCSALINGFLQTVGNLVRFDSKQNGLFNFHINTSISQKQVGHCEPEKNLETAPTILIEATDCQINQAKHKNASQVVASEGKFYGPVCLLNVRKKGCLETVPITVSFNVQNAGERENVCRPSDAVSADISKNTKTTQITEAFPTPIPSPPEPALQAITPYQPQPNFPLEKPTEFQATASQERNFIPAGPAPNVPYYGAQSLYSSYGTPLQSIVPVSNEEKNIQFPPAQVNEQRPPAVYSQQSSNDDLAGQVAAPPLSPPSPNSYPPQAENSPVLPPSLPFNAQTPDLPPTSPVTPDLTVPQDRPFDAPQQPFDVAPIPPQSEPQPLSDSVGQQFANNGIFGPAPENVQNPTDIVPPQPNPAPESVTTEQATVEDSQMNFPAPIANPEPSASGFGPNNIGNQLSELTTYNKPVINPYDFQPETNSYFSEPSDRNLDYTTQTPFYDSIPATYKSEPESQPDLSSTAQNLSGERPVAPDQAFSPSGIPPTPPRPELLPPLTPNDTVTENYSEQSESESRSFPVNPNVFIPPGNDYQMGAPGPNPQFTPQDQTLDNDRYAMEQPNPVPGVPNPFFGNQPPAPVPPFQSNQNGDLQQPVSVVTSQTSSETITEHVEGSEVYPQVPVSQIQPPNVPPYYPERRAPNEEFYPEPPRYPEPPFQAGPQVPSDVAGNEYQPEAPAALPEFPAAEEPTNRASYDDSQIPQMNYPNPELQNGQEQVAISTPPSPFPQNFPPQSDSNLNSPPTDMPLETAPLNSQNQNEVQETVQSDSLQPTPYPLPPVQNAPENSQVNLPPNYPLWSNVPPQSESLTKEVDNLTLNPDQPAGVSQPEPQNLNTYNQFPPTVPPQFTSQSSEEAVPPNADYPMPYQPQPSGDYYGEASRVQTANQIVTSTDEYQNPAGRPDGPLNYSQEIPFEPEVAAQSPPPPPTDQVLQPQTEFVQENPEMYSGNFEQRPQPQPSLDNLTEFPGEQTADSVPPSAPETSLPSETKPETFGSQPPSQTAFTETNTQDIQALDAQPKPESLNYLGPQTYPNFNGPIPTPNYPQQDGLYFPQTADSNTPLAPFTPDRAVTPPEMNPAEMAVNETSYLGGVMPLSEPSETQPVQETSPLIDIASPQPQSDTAVGYNEQITEQYQSSPAFNPQPQAPLKGDNMREELPQSPISQPPQFQLEMGQIEPQFPVPNGGEVDANGPPQFDQQMEQYQPQIPPFLTANREGETESPESSAPQVDQQMEQYPPQQYQPQLPPFSGPVREETESSTSSTSQFDQQIQQPQPQRPPFFGPNAGEVDYSLGRYAPQFDQQMEQPQPQLPPFDGQNREELVNDSFGRPAPQIDQPMMEQPQPQMPPFPTPNTEVETETSETSQVAQQMDQPQLPPYSGPNNGEVVSDAFETPAPQFDQQVGQYQPQFPRLPGPNSAETVTETSATSVTQVDQQTEPTQPQIQPFYRQNEGEAVSDTFVAPVPQFEQPMEQPQPQIPPFSTSNGGEEETFDNSAPQVDQQTEQYQPQQFQPQLPPSSGPNGEEDVERPPQFDQQVGLFRPQYQRFGPYREELVNDSPDRSTQQFDQQIEQSQSQLQPVNGPNGGEVESFSPPVDQFGQPMEQPQQQVPPFTTEERGQIESESFVTPAPQFEQPMEQPQPQIPPFSGPNMEEAVPESFARSATEFDQQNQQPQTNLQPFSEQNSGEGINESFPSQPPQFDQQTEQYQPQLPPVTEEEIVTETSLSSDFRVDEQMGPYGPQSPPSYVPNGNVNEYAGQQQQFEQQMQPYQPQLPPFNGQNREEIENESFGGPAPQFDQQMQQPQPQLPPFSGPNRGEIVNESFDRSAQQFDQQMEEPQTQIQPISGPNTGIESFPSDQFGQPMDQPQQQLPPFSNENVEQTQTQTESFVTPTPQFEQPMGQPQPQVPTFPTSNGGEGETESFDNSAPQVEQMEQPQLPPFSGPNRDEPIVERPPQFDQQVGLFRPQYQRFGPYREELVNDSPDRTSQQIDQQIEQSQSQLEPVYGPNGEVDQFGQPMEQPQQQVPPFSTEERGQIESESFVTPAPQFEQPQPEVPPFSGPNREEAATETFASSTTEFDQNQQPQTNLQPFAGQNSEEAMNESFPDQPPQFDQQIGQPQPQIPPYSGPNMEEAVAESLESSTSQAEQPTEQPQSQPFFGPYREEAVNYPYGRYAPQFNQQMEQPPQTELPPVSEQTREELANDSFESSAPQTEQPVQPFSGQDGEEPAIEPSSRSLTLFGQPIEQEDSLLSAENGEQVEADPSVPAAPQAEQPFIGSNRREDAADSFASRPPQFDQQMEQYQPPFYGQNRESFGGPAPQFDQQPQTPPQPFSGPRTEESFSQSYSSTTSEVVQGQYPPQVPPFSAQTGRELATDSFVTPAPKFEQLIGQPQTQLQPFARPNGGQMIRNSYGPANWNSEQNFVNPQSSQTDAGVNMARDVMSAPRPDSLVPVSDPTDPSNGPGEEYVSCCDRCARGQTPLACPFDPINKGNMTAPSYYILISKLPVGEDKDEQFQVEKVYLGDGTPLDCTLSSGRTFPTRMYTPVPFRAVGKVKFEPKSDFA